jgi:serine/threonine protein kinase
MKSIKKELVIKTDQIAGTKAEREILQKLDHPFIMKLQFAFQDTAHLYLVMDFVNGGELFFHLNNAGRFSEERARFYCAEMVLAL